MTPRDEFVRFLAARGLDASASALTEYAAFLDAMYAWNESKNLTRVPVADAWTRHLMDSLLFVDLIPSGASVLDVGTGPGLPAWPIAFARPDLSVTALDSNAKMTAFLETRERPNLRVVTGRVEESRWRDGFDVVTGRAVAPLSIQLESCVATCKVGGAVAPLRTARETFELQCLGDLGLELETVVERELGEATRACPIYRKTRPTPGRYPRRWSDMKRKPLL